MSIWERRREPEAALGHEAERDARIGDVDWHVLPEGTVTSTFAAPSGELAMISLGDPTDPRVLLIPGVTGSKEDFILMLPELAAAGYYVQSYDLAGQYQSAGAGPLNPANPASWTYRLFIDDLLAILRSGSTPVHVLGYSFAGTVAQLALLEAPDLFASLALLGSPPVSGQSFRSVRTIGVISPFTTPETAAALMIWGVRTNKNKAPSHRVSFVRERFELTNRNSVAGIMGLMKQTPEVAERLRAMPQPKLVATGTHDLWPVDLHRAFATRIGAEFASYRTGHSPCETTPYQFSRDLLALYSSTTPSS